MHKRLATFLAVCLLLAMVPAVMQGQDGPPKVISITQEFVKPGQGPAHEKWEASWNQALIRAKVPVRTLTVTSVTGGNEIWFINGYASFADWEKGGKAFEAPAISSVMDQYMPKETEFLSEARTLVAVYRPDLSFHPGIKLGEMRYFNVRSTRVRDGHGDEYEEIMKLVNSARESGNVDVHVAVFQVVSGLTGTNYLSFITMKSAAEMDQPSNLMNALGDEGRKKLNQLVEKSVAASNVRLYAFSPRLSYPTDAMMAEDPAFWKPKPAPMAAKPAAKKEAEKPKQ